MPTRKPCACRLALTDRRARHPKSLAVTPRGLLKVPDGRQVRIPTRFDSERGIAF